jgi:hypothetical protein
MWSQIDENMILRYTPAKTQFTSGATVTLDLNMMPMVVEELAKVPVEARRGPLIVNPRTGLPYRPACRPSVTPAARMSRFHTSLRMPVIMRTWRHTSPKYQLRHRPTIWPSRLVTPTSARPPRSMTAPSWKRRAESPRPGPRIVATQSERVCRNASQR